MTVLGFWNEHVSGCRLRITTLFFFFLFFVVSCGEKTIAKKSIHSVKAFKVSTMNAPTIRSFPGHAEANEEVNLGFDLGGTLIERPVDKGDRVIKGQLLARLDPRDYKSELAAAITEQERAKTYHNRIEEALKARAVSEQELTDAQAKLKQASARVNIKRKALCDTNIFAPFDGVVSTTFVENFQRVRAKERILRLLDISKIKFTVDIPESMIPYMPYVHKIWIVYSTLETRKIPATIKEMGTEASEATRTYQVTLIHDQPEDSIILPGMTGGATAEVQLPEHISTKVIEVPVSALFSEDKEGSTCVWVIDKENMLVKKRAVETGWLTNFGIKIQEGLNPGEWIVTAGVHYLQDGQQVHISNQSSQKEAQ